MNKKTTKNKAICPCCLGEVTLSECSQMQSMYDSLYKKGQMYSKGNFESNWPTILGRMACDDCLVLKKAIKGNPGLQVFNGQWDSPFFAYWDKTAVCTTCNEEFIFSKEEQQFWYEKLHFIIYSFPKECPKCRKEKRQKIAQNNRLMELLASDYLNDIEAMKEIAATYKAMGNEEKSALFLRRITNLNN